MDGIINLLKTAGMTSHDAVYFIRNLTGEKHVGHTGTLDPQASGVLTLCLGTATRFIEHIEGDTKSYRAEFMLGVSTETGDIWGGRIDGKDTDLVKAFDPKDRYIPEEGWPSEETVREALGKMKGIQTQIPPAYSAIKVHGAPLYKLMRKGREMPEIPRRTVEIHAIELVSYDAETGVGMFDLVCSKGTYVRSLIEDLGNALDTGAAMSALIRTAAGPFTIDDCATIDELRRNVKRYILPLGTGLDHFGTIVLKPGRDAWFSNGGYIVKSDWLSFEEAKPRERAIRHHNHEKDILWLPNYKVLNPEGDFLGTCYWNAEKKYYVPDKVLPQGKTKEHNDRQGKHKMVTYTELAKIRYMPETCVALGYFDGIHAGHQALIGKCVEDARKRGVKSCVFTFSNSPKNALKKLAAAGGTGAESGTAGSGTDKANTFVGGVCVKTGQMEKEHSNAPEQPTALMTWEEKVRALKDMGVDYLIAPPFDDAIRSMSPEDFVRKLLVEKCHMVGAYCGFNYSFGYKAGGKPEDLMRMGKEGVPERDTAEETGEKTSGCYDTNEEKKKHYDTYIQEPYTINGNVVSSTLVRSVVLEGKIEEANKYLGHRFSLEGVTTPGRHIGSSIGFPTANFTPDPILLLPPDGVYATMTEIGGKEYLSVTNIGTNPTVSENGTKTEKKTNQDEYSAVNYKENGETISRTAGTLPERRVETHLFDPPCRPLRPGETQKEKPAETNLYGKHIRVYFLRHLRGEVKFSGTEELKAQIAKDKASAKEYLKPDA